MTDRDKIIETMARALCRRKTDENTYGDVSEEAVKNYVDAAWRLFSSDAEAALTALQASGMAVVPVEPTLDMVRDGAAKTQDFCTEAGPYPRTKAVWKAMLSASPSFNPVVQEKKDE